MDMSFYIEFCCPYMVTTGFCHHLPLKEEGCLSSAASQQAPCAVSVPDLRKRSRETEREEKWKMIYNIFFAHVRGRVWQIGWEEGKYIFKSGNSL